MMTRPARLTVNAWTGSGSPTIDLPAQSAWQMPAQRRSKILLETRGLAPPSLVDPRDWRSERVGWGLVLPDDPTLDAATKSRGDDAPEPLRTLLKAHQFAPVIGLVALFKGGD